MQDEEWAKYLFVLEPRLSTGCRKSKHAAVALARFKGRDTRQRCHVALQISPKRHCVHSVMECHLVLCVIIPTFTVNKCLDTVGCLVSHESWNIMIPARALFNYLLSFCPIDLHCEPFNYTIHHLLNMKNGVKCMLIKPCRKVFCKGLVNQANGLCGLCVFMHVCVVFSLFFFSHFFLPCASPSILLNPQQQANGGSMSLNAGAVN